MLNVIYPGLVEIISKNPHFQPDLEVPILRILRFLDHMKDGNSFPYSKNYFENSKKEISEIWIISDLIFTSYKTYIFKC